MTVILCPLIECATSPKTPFFGLLNLSLPFPPPFPIQLSPARGGCFLSTISAVVALTALVLETEVLTNQRKKVRAHPE